MSFDPAFDATFQSLVRSCPWVSILVSVGCQKPGHLAARLEYVETKVTTWDDLAFKLIILGISFNLFVHFIINTPSWNRPAFYNNDEDDDEDYTTAITPDFSITDSLIMEDEHLDTISENKSDQLIKSSVENLVPNPTKSEDLSNTGSECDVPVCDDFTTFSNLLFDVDDNFSSSDDKSFSDEDVPKEIYSNPLFNEEIISIKIDPHHFNAESDLIQSLLNQGSSIISSPKFDSLLEEFSGELAHIDLIPSGINETEFDPEEEIRLVERLLYDNSSPRPPKEPNSKNSDAIIESFSPSPIPVDDSDPFMEEIDLFLASDGSIPSVIDSDYSDSEGDNLFLERLLHDDPIPIPDILNFSNVVRIFLPLFTYLVTSSILLSSGSEDIIFDPGISNYHFFSLEPGVSHRSGAFMKFNVYPNHLNESPREILSSTCFPMDQ
uniref:Reverse transcriptase domain-containing protein n=1 Tax=Tanacetum cinerariifolium TaxID=118510 RepID=A0A699GX45_TANCI|nr:hypothetical protein [Tanacetum cinerariifolium]